MPVQENPTRHQLPLVVIIIAVVLAALIFWGVWTFLQGERHPAQRHPPQTSQLQEQRISWPGVGLRNYSVEWYPGIASPGL